jgi:hypothetical protein
MRNGVYFRILPRNACFFLTQTEPPDRKKSPRNGEKVGSNGTV